MSDLRTFTLEARELLTRETTNLLREVYGLQEDATFLSPSDVPPLHRLEGAAATRTRLEQLFADEAEAGVSAPEAYRKLVKEVAFTHLNRLVAFKMMEARRLIRETIRRLHDSNGFKLYVVDHADDLALYEQGTSPADDRGEGPRDRAYRHFLLWQCEQLAQEIRVLFDAENLASQIFPRPRVLKELLDRLNADDLKEFWTEGNEETIGWVYQAFNSLELEQAFREARTNKKKFEKEDIPSVTQLFTPHATVRFLVENSLGRLWLEMHPDSALAGRWASLVPAECCSRVRPMKPAKEITVLDPAAGTMHFGLVAFDLLVEMYREELTNEGREGWPERASVAKDDEIAASILRWNLFGIDIDLRAVQLSALALFLRARSYGPTRLTASNLACADIAMFQGRKLDEAIADLADGTNVAAGFVRRFCLSANMAGLMGSLVRIEEDFRSLQAQKTADAVDRYIRVNTAHGHDERYFSSEANKGLRFLDIVRRRYDVVCTNPPYISARKMNPSMASFLRKAYPEGKGDTYAAFIQRCAELANEDGFIAMLTMHSFMFISTYEELRERLDSTTSVVALNHYGPALFDVGNPGTLQTAAFVLRRSQKLPQQQDRTGTYFRLVKEPDAAAKQRAFEEALAHLRTGQPDSRVFTYCQQDFSAIPGSPWVYWADPVTRSVFKNFPQLGTLYDVDMGLKTSGNARFVRLWWEVGIKAITTPRDRAGALAANGRWFWYAKGDKGLGTSRLRFVVNWQSDGRELKAHIRHQYPYLNGRVEWCTHDENKYFHPCVTWSPISSSGFRCRIVPAGIITSNAAYGIFCGDAEIEALTGYLLSLPGRYLIKILCSTINHNKGDIQKLPVPVSILREPEFQRIARAAITSVSDDDRGTERSATFVAPQFKSLSQRVEGWDPKWALDNYVARQLELQSEVERMEEVISLRPDQDNERPEVDSEDEEDEVEAVEGGEAPSEGLAHDWVGYAVGIALGRFQPGLETALGRGNFSPQMASNLRSLTASDGPMLLSEGHPDDLAQRVLAILEAIHGDATASDIIRTAAESNGPLRDGLERYLLGPFFKDHVKRYCKRPVYWLLQSPGRTFSAYLFHECASADTLAVLQGVRYLGGQIRRFEAEHQEAQQRERSATGRERNGWSRRARDLVDALDDLRQMDRAIQAINNHPVKDCDGRPAVVRWEPELDDGVLLNAAPLHALAPSWKKADTKLDLKKAWAELERGVYDWSHTAMRYWPQRVLKACEENESFAIAHGLR